MGRSFTVGKRVQARGNCIGTHLIDSPNSLSTSHLAESSRAAIFSARTRAPAAAPRGAAAGAAFTAVHPPIPAARAAEDGAGGENAEIHGAGLQPPAPRRHPNNVPDAALDPSERSAPGTPPNLEDREHLMNRI